MKKTLLYFLLLTVSLASAEEKANSLSLREACTEFSNAVVRIEAGGKSLGTGFIVSPDGFIMTAAHVIRDESGQQFSAISVGLPDGTRAFARALNQTAESVGRDYAVLKVEDRSNLPFLILGSNQGIANGSDAIMIGFPFSAITSQGKRVSTKFCLAITIAASDLETVPVNGTRQVGQSAVPFNNDVEVDVIYFQGPSVKGVSGSPLISRNTGKVIGIVTQKLSGIGQSLSDLRNQAASASQWGTTLIQGINTNAAFADIVTVLDQQLANGLGAATGIDDPKHALTQAQRQAKKQNK
jgi:hypothetical protein